MSGLSSAVPLCLFSFSESSLVLSFSGFFDTGDFYGELQMHVTLESETSVELMFYGTLRNSKEHKKRILCRKTFFLQVNNSPNLSTDFVSVDQILIILSSQ